MVFLEVDGVVLFAPCDASTSELSELSRNGLDNVSPFSFPSELEVENKGAFPFFFAMLSLFLPVNCFPPLQ